MSRRAGPRTTTARRPRAGARPAAATAGSGARTAPRGRRPGDRRPTVHSASTAATVVSATSVSGHTRRGAVSGAPGAASPGRAGRRRAARRQPTSSRIGMFQTPSQGLAPAGAANTMGGGLHDAKAPIRTHPDVKAEPVDVGAQGLARCGLARHRPSQGEHPAACGRAEGDAVRHRPRLQRAQRARLLILGIRLGEVRPAIVIDPHAPAREQRHPAGDDRLQQRVQRLLGGRGRLDELRHPGGVAAVYPFQRSRGRPTTARSHRAQGRSPRCVHRGPPHPGPWRTAPSASGSRCCRCSSASAMAARLDSACGARSRASAVASGVAVRWMRGCVREAAARQPQAFIDQRLQRRILASRHRLAAFEQIVRQFDGGRHMGHPSWRYG